MTDNIINIDFGHMAVTPPERPNKFDIIPIHNSDRAAFKFCRRQWTWGSPSRANLIPRAEVYGIEKNLWFGTGIHYALEQFYNPVLSRDPEEAWLSWFELQWRGGVVNEDEVKQFADRNPQLLPNGGTSPVWQTYKVDGLADILPDTFMDEEMFMEMKDTGAGMMRFYKDYAQANDNFTVIALEHDFSVPIFGPDGNAFYAVDKRPMPEGWEPDFEKENEFGPLMYMDTDKTPSIAGDYRDTGVIYKQVHVRGREDMIVQDNEHGRFGIVDHKTTSRIDDDYFRHLDLDEQCTSYLSYGEVEAKLHNLEYKSLEFIMYQAILKAYPKPPTFTQKGLPSINRNEETTTAELFAKAVKDNGLEMIFNVDQKMQSYYTWLLEQGDKRFIQRNETWRNRAQKANALTRAYFEARDMLSDPVPYPSPSKNYGCLNCRFRGPCIAAESGDDYVTMLEDGYMPNWDR